MKSKKSLLVVSMLGTLFLVASAKLLFILKLKAKESFSLTFGPYPVSSVLGPIVLAFIFGIIISLPIKLRNAQGRFEINSPKLFLQGIPALIIAIPYEYLIVFVYMDLLGIQSFSFGVLNPVITFLARGGATINILAAVWLGKVVADSIDASAKPPHKKDEMQSF